MRGHRIALSREPIYHIGYPYFPIYNRNDIAYRKQAKPSIRSMQHPTRVVLRWKPNETPVPAKQHQGGTGGLSTIVLSFHIGRSFGLKHFYSLSFFTLPKLTFVLSPRNCKNTCFSHKRPFWSFLFHTIKNIEILAFVRRKKQLNTQRV